MVALVTGGGGFLGRYIIDDLLARGEQVRNLARGYYPELAKLGVECFAGDLRDPGIVMRACAGADIVFHAAGVAGIWGPWDHYHGINVLGTRHVIEACRAHRVPRLVYTSSPSVTFDGRPQQNVDESVGYATRWLCHYAQTKAQAEQEVLAANDEHLATCALRPHLIWGPGDPHLVPRLIARARAGQLRRVGDGSNLIDMVYVENAARAHLQAADVLGPDSPVAGRAYFISQGEPVNCWQWIDELLALVDIPPVRQSISTSLAWGAGAVLEQVHRIFGLKGEPRMTRFLAAQLGMPHYFNLHNARHDFGYEPWVGKEEGMRRLQEALLGQ